MATTYKFNVGTAEITIHYPYGRRDFKHPKLTAQQLLIELVDSATASELQQEIKPSVQHEAPHIKIGQ